MFLTFIMHLLYLCVCVYLTILPSLLHSSTNKCEYLCRCIVFLLLPQFFSKRGRQALMAYAFILTLTGPAKNILNNISVLSESLACGQVSFYRWVCLRIPFMSLHNVGSLTPHILDSIHCTIRSFVWSTKDAYTVDCMIFSLHILKFTRLIMHFNLSSLFESVIIIILM